MSPEYEAAMEVVGAIQSLTAEVESVRECVEELADAQTDLRRRIAIAIVQGLMCGKTVLEVHRAGLGGEMTDTTVRAVWNLAGLLADAEPRDADALTPATAPKEDA